MHYHLRNLFISNGGVLGARTIRTATTASELRRLLSSGEVSRPWNGVYCQGSPNLQLLLRCLDVLFGQRVVACLHTAAALHGFDIVQSVVTHILDPGAHSHICRASLRIHQRYGAPLASTGGRLATAPAWTAIEVARLLPRPRALAVLDAAIASGSCSATSLADALHHQRRRRGIVQVRNLLPLADGRAGSPMESEARLVFHDAGLPAPELQFPVTGETTRYLDFAWPAAKYDGDEFHSSPLAVRNDKARLAWLQDRGWLVIPITADDVRRYPQRLAWRIAAHLAARTDASEQEVNARIRAEQELILPARRGYGDHQIR